MYMYIHMWVYICAQSHSGNLILYIRKNSTRIFLHSLHSDLAYMVAHTIIFICICVYIYISVECSQRGRNIPQSSKIKSSPQRVWNKLKMIKNTVENKTLFLIDRIHKFLNRIFQSIYLYNCERNI